MEFERPQVAEFMRTIYRRLFMFKAGVVVYLLFFTSACSAQERTLTQQQFWTEFRQAALSNDNKKLEAMTHFPLEVRGVDDSQPVTRYKKEQFDSIFKKILNQPIITMEGDKIITNTTKSVINSSNTITKDHIMTGDSFRVDQLVFELKNKQWKLVRAYLEE